jgi:hypothetical protein
LVYLGLSLFCFVRAFKYRFYDFRLIGKEITQIILWSGCLLDSLITPLRTLVNYFITLRTGTYLQFVKEPFNLALSKDKIFFYIYE